jgi:DNA-binding NarL/FixJ family response regulator
MNKIKVLIADDHKIIRVGLRGLIELSKDIEVVAEAENGTEVIELVKKVTVDVVLMDIDMGHTSGIETTQQLKKEHPKINVLGLTMHEEQEYIVEMLEAGASGYLLKNTGMDELLTAIRTAAKGDSYFSHQVSTTLLQAITQKKTFPTFKSNHNGPLTEREIEVLQLIAREFSNGEIAEKLFISIRTVDTHRRNLLEKLQVKNTAGLVKYAMEKGLA